jgi:hypothetical protein
MRYQHIELIVGVGLLAILAAGTVTGFAEPVANGNELALAYSITNSAGRQIIQKKSTDTIQTFRYLKIVAIANDTPKPGAITLTTVEPSSDMKVVLVLTTKLSLDIAKTATTNECVAANGRVKSIGTEAPDMIVMDPVALRHKDRAGPKMSKELLNEVDPTAH